MTDRMRHVTGAAPGGAPLSRRRMLAACAGVAVLPPVLAACTTGTGTGDDDPAALGALADQARADAALVVAAVTGDPGLSTRLEPLRAARMAHAGELDAATGRTVPPGTAPSGSEPVDLARVRDSVLASARAAADVVPRASTARVGLVAEVAACCATYATVLV